MRFSVTDQSYRKCGWVCHVKVDTTNGSETIYQVGGFPDESAARDGAILWIREYCLRVLVEFGFKTPVPLKRLKYAIDARLNNVLCEMKPDYDDSITGFNEAWDIVRKTFKEYEPQFATQPASPLRGREWAFAIYEAARLIENHAREMRHNDTTLTPDGLTAIGQAIAALSSAPPEQPLRGRESVREIAHKHCTCTCRGDPEVLQNHTNLCDEISDAILEYAVLSSAAPEQPAALPLAVHLRDEAGPPLPQMIAQRRAQLSQEQPAATPDIVKMYSDMERAKNARIGELEEALGKAVLSAPPVRQLTENERDAIAIAEHQCDCCSPSDPEVRFDYEVIRTLLSLIPVPKEAT